jgi:serine/threonine protein kinase
MNTAVDETLLRRLPLPLARLYRLACGARTPLEQHTHAFYLWEAALKLLGSVAVVECLAGPGPDDMARKRLARLPRPALGDWWDLICQLVPRLAGCGDPSFAAVGDLLLGGAPQDLPRVAALAAALGEDQRSTPGKLRLSQLLDELLAYRNRELGHGMDRQRPNDFYAQMARALLEGAAELLGRLDVLAGRRLIYLASQYSPPATGVPYERFELAGEVPVPVGPLHLSGHETGYPPVADRLYLLTPETAPATPRLYSIAGWLPLTPLVNYNPESGEVFFFHRGRGSRPAEYLCFSTGRFTSIPYRVDPALPTLAELLDIRSPEETPLEPQVPGEARPLSAEDTAMQGPRSAELPAAPGPYACRLGEYEVQIQVGTGGLGTIYRGWQPMLERAVCLKTLPGALAQVPQARERFLREIRILGQVRHPNLVQVYGSGIGQDGTLFYAMEWIEGTSLEALQRRPDAMQGGPWLARVVELLRQVAGAVEALHQAGVVHRNLTPDNIMVTADGTRAVLIDLGSAKEGVREGGLTRTRQLVGTLRYASPEQVLAVDRLDGRSDVYNLGATLWELMTLRPMFNATEENTPTAELMQRIQYEEPERPRKYNPTLPRDLEAVVLKCLEKEPARRYQTAAELAEDLGRFLARRPVSVRPQNALERLVTWLRRPWQTSRGVTSLSLPALAPPAAAPPRSPVVEAPAPSAPVRAAAAPSQPPPAAPLTAPDLVFSSQLVVTLYPAPLAFPYRRFYQETEPRSRLDALFSVVEAAVRYLLTLGISDLFACLAEPGRDSTGLPAHPVFDILRQRRPVSLGTCVDALAETARALDAEDASRRVLQELPQVCRPGGPFVQELVKPLVRQRNQCAHPDGTVHVSTQECKDVLRDYRSRLEEMLRQVQFVCRYPLGFLSPFAGMTVTGGARYYHLHACMGAAVRSTGRAVDLKADVELRHELPFVVAPDGSRLLYLWPLLLQRRSEYTGRRTLWAFQEIPEDKGRFLTRARWAAVDGREDFSDKLHDRPAADHAWLLERLRQLPPAPDVPPELRLAERLWPTRGGKLVGQEVGSNHLVAVLAVGGFGTIYAAEAADGKRVAVKVIETRLSDAQLTRFRQEFDKLRLAAEHRGIVRCFEYGDVYVDGRVCPWYSMEFALGGDLRSQIDRRKGLLKGATPWSDPAARSAVCAQFAEVAAAVAHLHELGLVHRDLKPGNILVMEDGALRLSDFGLVKNLRPTAETLEHGPHTTTGASAGTPGYMAPEQARGREVDQRADVYSLGVLLAEMALSERPQADLPGDMTTTGSTLRKCAGLRQLPRGLRSLIERCTDVEPARRPEHASAVAEEFQQLVGQDGEG